MRRSSMQLLVANLFGIAAMLAGGPAIAEDPSAGATLINSEGHEVGKVSLTESPNGVLLHAELHDIPAGTHGFHLHTVGSCTPDFKAAGGHFNPTGKKHGFMAKEGAHLGDMPNIHVPASGALTFEFFLPEVTIATGETQLLDSDGTAVMVHAKPDDYRTDPAGDAGDRIACGVIKKK